MLDKSLDGVILDARIFGSVARGDDDKGSDLDILVVVNRAVSDEEVRKRLELPKRADISLYSSDRLIKMYGEGHLFAWHLYSESLPFDVDLKFSWLDGLGAPSPYAFAEHDLNHFFEILSESIKAVEQGSDVVFEGGICHLAMRNIGMIVCYIRDGKPNFSRYSILDVSNELRPKITRQACQLLFECRRLSQHGGVVEENLSKQVLKIFTELKSWLSAMGRGKYV